MPENEHSHGDQSHDHSEDLEGSSTRKLGLVSGINLVGFVVELFGGLMFGSIALLSDAFHMLFDSVAYVMAFASSYLAEKKSGNAYWSFGLHRLETFSAFLNGALLIPMALYILWESYQRFIRPVSIGFIPTLAIGFGGLLVNMFSVYFLEGGEMSLNEKGAFYHLLGDAGGSVAVIVSTVLVQYAGLKVADPAAAILISGMILWSAGKVLMGSTTILLQRAPVDPAKLEEKMEDLELVEGVKELRVWSLCSQVVVCSVHVLGSSETLEEADRTKAEVREVLKEEGVDHATIETEGQGNDCTHEVEH